MAKNILEKSFRLWFDNSSGTPVDLTDDLIPGTINGGGVQLDQVDMSGVKKAVREYLSGHGDAPVSGQFHMNPAADGAFGVLESMNGSAGTLTLQYGQAGADPTAGDAEFEGEYTCFMQPVTQSSGKMVFSCTFMPAPDATSPDWGTV